MFTSPLLRPPTTEPINERVIVIVIPNHGMGSAFSPNPPGLSSLRDQRYIHEIGPRTGTVGELVRGVAPVDNPPSTQSCRVLSHRREPCSAFSSSGVE